MGGGEELGHALTLVTWIVAALAALTPLAFALYGFTRQPRDGRLVRGGLLTATLVAAAWGLWALKDARTSQELEAARAEVEALKLVPEGRGFTPAARKTMVDSLRKIAGPTAFVLANSTDLETTQYARQIVGVLKDAGWKVPPSFGMMFTPVLLPGQEEVPARVVIGVTPEVSNPMARAILVAFEEGGVDVTLGPHWPGTEHPISILVGPREDPY